MISTAILNVEYAVEYAVFQPVAPPRMIVSSLGVSRVPKNGKPAERAIAVDEATAVPNPFWGLYRSISSAGDGGTVSDAKNGEPM